MDEQDVSDPRKYVRLAAVLRARITSGQFALGEKLPTVAAIAEEHGVSPQTATKALHTLMRDGLVARVTGMGFFVKTRQAPPPVASTGDGRLRANSRGEHRQVRLGYGSPRPARSPVQRANSLHLRADPERRGRRRHLTVVRLVRRPA